MSFERVIQLESPTITPGGASKTPLLQKTKESGFGSMRKTPLSTMPNSTDYGGDGTHVISI